MGMYSPQGPREPRLRAFHAELATWLFEQDRMGEIIDSATWNKLLAHSLGTLSRQAVVDYTFAMECLGMIELTKPQHTGKQGRPGRGVIVLPIQALAELQPDTSLLLVPA